MTPNEYVQQVHELFAAHKDPEQAVQMSNYMRNQFLFFGLKAPQRKALLTPFFKKNGLPPLDEASTIWRACWEAEEREMQYFLQASGMRLIKKLDLSFLDFFEELIQQKSWWDTVDFIAPKFCGGLFLKYPSIRNERTERWIASDNSWLQRSALIFQLAHREKTDFEWMTRMILARKDSTEFFVNKGAGWALRQYSRWNPLAVQAFIEAHQHELHPLTVKEGRKNLEKHLRR